LGIPKKKYAVEERSPRKKESARRKAQRRGEEGYDPRNDIQSGIISGSPKRLRRIWGKRTAPKKLTQEEVRKFEELLLTLKVRGRDPEHDADPLKKSTEHEKK